MSSLASSSLVAWLTYPAYFHARVPRGWRGQTAPLLLIASFAAVMLSYIVKKRLMTTQPDTPERTGPTRADDGAVVGKRLSMPDEERRRRRGGQQ